MAGINTLDGGFDGINGNTGGSVTPETGSVHYDINQSLSTDEKNRAKANIGVDYSGKADKVGSATQVVAAAMKLKDAYSLEEKL